MGAGAGYSSWLSTPILVLVPVIAATSGDDVDRWALRNVGDSDEALVAGATSPLPPPSRSTSCSSTESKDVHAASAGWISSPDDDACIICSCKYLRVNGSTRSRGEISCSDWQETEDDTKNQQHTGIHTRDIVCLGRRVLAGTIDVPF